MSTLDQSRELLSRLALKQRPFARRRAQLLAVISTALMLVLAGCTSRYFRPAPTFTTAHVPTIAEGVYSITAQGRAGGFPFTQIGTIEVLPGQKSHAIEVCFYTGSSPATWSDTPDAGMIGFASNSVCYGPYASGNTMSVDYSLLRENYDTGEITMTADPTKCCSSNLSANGYTIAHGVGAIVYYIGQGSMTLQFSNGSPDLTGSIHITGCTLDPYCAGNQYNAIIWGYYVSGG